MTSGENRRTRIEDVAEAAGVSVATVSRALRGLPNVAAGTRLRVKQIAEKLQYRPDPNASRLATGRSGAIGLAVPVFNAWYFSEVVAGAEAVLTDAGYDVIISSIQSHEQRTLFVSRSADQRCCEGIIMVGLALDQAECDLLLRSKVHAVTTGTKISHFPGVVIDNVAVGADAAAHLADLGHRRIGLIAAEEDPLDFSVPQDRRRGFEAELQRRGLPLPAELTAAGNFSVDGGGEAMQQLLKQPDPPTAVFAMSDEMAIGAVHAARQAGLEVPGELSVVGVDDHELAEPFGLTTIRQGVDTHGPLAARQLLDLLAGEEPAVPTTVVPTRLVVRSSTGAAPPGTGGRR